MGMRLPVGGVPARRSARYAILSTLGGFTYAPFKAALSLLPAFQGCTAGVMRRSAMRYACIAAGLSQGGLIRSEAIIHANLDRVEIVVVVERIAIDVAGTVLAEVHVEILDLHGPVRAEGIF